MGAAGKLQAAVCVNAGGGGSVADGAVFAGVRGGGCRGAGVGRHRLASGGGRHGCDVGKIEVRLRSY